MISQGRIGPRSAVIITVLFVSLSLFFAPSIAADYGITAAWMVISLAGLLAMAASVLPWLLMRNFPDRTIIEVGYVVAGRYLGFILGLIIFSYFLLNMAVSLRMVGERIQAAYLPGTPLSVTMLTLLAVGAVGAFLGLEAIARAIVIASGLLLASGLIPILLTRNFWNMFNFLPWLGSGLKPIAIGGISMMGMFSDVLLLALIYPSISKEQRGGGNIWLQSAFWCFVLAFFITVGTQMVFPYPVLNENLFPLTQVSRLVYEGRFLQRIDAFISFFWYGAYAFKFSLAYLLAANALTQLLRLPYYRPFLFGLGIIAFTLGMVPHDIMESTYIVTNIIWRLSPAVAFLLPGLLFLVTLFRRKEGAG